MTLDNVCFYVHYLLIVVILIGPFVLPLVWIKPYILFLIAVIIHWYVLNGKCIISLMHQASSENEGVVSNCIKKSNIPLIDEFIDALFYFVILYSFYRIQCVKEGILVVVIIILLNKTIYDKYGFEWSEKKIVKINRSDNSNLVNSEKKHPSWGGGTDVAVGGGVGAGIGYIVFRGPVGAGLGAGVGALASNIISKTQDQ